MYVASDAEQELEAKTERDKIGKQPASDKKARSAGDERHSPTLLALIKPWRDESPNLIQNPRRTEKKGDQQRKLQIDDVESLHRSDLRQVRRIHSEVL